MKYILIALFLLNGNNIFSQEFGGNPAKTKWLQVDTDSIRVIFPKGMEDAARRIVRNAAIIQYQDKSSLGSGQRKINLVLQNGKTISNAYVGLAPWRSEFYTTAPQDPFILGAFNWIDNLSIHETRHVQQYSNFNKGFSNFASFILGEQGQALANAIAVPDWFFEGDAVYNETKFSPQGRGKLPFFLSSYQSLYRADKHYNYMQLRNGSYRKYIPDHYDLGYLLVAYGRKRFGDSVWKDISSNAASFKPFFYPFQGAFKNVTHIKFDQFVDDAMKFYESKWTVTKEEKINWLTPLVKNDVVDYRYPYAAEDGAMIVLKKSLKNIPAFYLIKSNRSETKIANRSIAVDDYYSYNNGKIIYAAYQPDLRWGNREYNQLKLLDISTGLEQTIVGKSKYYSPDISHGGSKILVIEPDPVGGSSLLELDLNGKEINRITKKDWVFASPKFSASDQYLYVTARNSRGEMSLLKKAVGNKDSLQTILPFVNKLIGYLQIHGDTLIFTTTNSGNDEIWALLNAETDKGAFKIFRMAVYPTGLYQALIRQDGKLVCSAFTAEGYRLAAFEPLWKPVRYEDALTNLCLPEIFEQNDQNKLKDAADRSFLPVTKYSKSKGLLHFHSWRPLYSNPEYSFTLFSDNILNTYHSELAYTYNQNEGSSKLGYSGIYGGSFFQPVFGLDQTWGRSGLYHVDTTIHWNETNAYIGLQLPLDLSGGNAYRFLTVSSTYNLQQVKWTGIGQKLLKDLDFNSIQSRIAYFGQIQKSKQQIYTHWGQNLIAQYKTQVGNYSSNQLLLAGTFYLPGFSNNHNILVSAAYQTRDTLQQYVFTNNFPFSRGYTAIDFPRMWKLGLSYHFPLCYPEWGFGNLVYLSRVRMNVFYDYTQGKSLRTGNKYEFASAGSEIFFDTKWWNQQPVSFGIRFSRLLNNEFRGVTQPNVWEFVLPVTLF